MSNYQHGGPVGGGDFDVGRARALLPLLRLLGASIQAAAGEMQLELQARGYVTPETARRYVLLIERAVSHYADRAEEVLGQRTAARDPREHAVDVPRPRTDVPDALPNDGWGFFDV